MARQIYRFPLKNLKTCTITFSKNPEFEDWQGVNNWLKLWGGNLCEEDDTCENCGYKHPGINCTDYF